MRFNKVLLMVFLTLVCTVSNAHTKLNSSQPADGAQLSVAPPALSLNYSGAVRPIKVQLRSGSGELVSFGFKPSAQAATSFRWALPMLADRDYRVNWIVVGGDGHKMKGEFSFTLAPDKEN